GHLPLERCAQRSRRVDRRVQDQTGDPLAEAGRIVERYGGPQANAADVVSAQAQPIGERSEKVRVAHHREGRIARRRLAASGQVRNQDPPVPGERRTPAMEVLEGADETVTEKQRMAGPFVEVSDPPLPDIDELDVLSGDRGLLFSRVDLRALQAAAVVHVDRLPLGELVERDGAGLAMAVAGVLHTPDG